MTVTVEQSVELLKAAAERKKNKRGGRRKTAKSASVMCHRT